MLAEPAPPHSCAFPYMPHSAKSPDGQGPQPHIQPPHALVAELAPFVDLLAPFVDLLELLELLTPLALDDGLFVAPPEGLFVAPPDAVLETPLDAGFDIGFETGFDIGFVGEPVIIVDIVVVDVVITLLKLASIWPVVPMFWSVMFVDCEGYSKAIPADDVHVENAYPFGGDA